MYVYVKQDQFDQLLTDLLPGSDTCPIDLLSVTVYDKPITAEQLSRFVEVAKKNSNIVKWHFIVEFSPGMFSTISVNKSERELKKLKLERFNWAVRAGFIGTRAMCFEEDSFQEMAGRYIQERNKCRLLKDTYVVSVSSVPAPIVQELPPSYESLHKQTPS